MKPETTRHYHQLLADLIEHVLRCRQGPIRVPELAEFAGFSRFHLTRLFRQVTEETLEDFLRRIRLERAAYALHHSEALVFEISSECGYRSPEAFSRAFRSAFGVLPTEFRRLTEMSWMLPSPSDLHWNQHWADEDVQFVETDIRYIPVRVAAVWRVVGNYARLADGWQRFQEQFGDRIPVDATFITVYLDNMWTHPTAGTMRADIGWILNPGAEPPPGMRRFEIHAGPYAVTRRYLARTERNDAWSYLCGRFSQEPAVRRSLVSYDEYRAWPLPFGEVETRILIGLPK
ncbi:helix-turn-helix domain-containing protein [Fimbriimonas ginsengisoli]|uniref:Transcriptional regulator, AraC family n=1 Tax=Fimbriimonas ginsengisoli Gsoil 348 TaxID=661478 RepID=A0A068NNQ7_FIMGI|nr:helix-turn-helix domain-containing protein [Fimbriimonas ginsengisoli]AIE85193.1 Transcriptional regulator, AraC family [Fimbriimonas ginsengisoli Gsoil 348]